MTIVKTESRRHAPWNPTGCPLAHFFTTHTRMEFSTLDPDYRVWLLCKRCRAIYCFGCTWERRQRPMRSIRKALAEWDYRRVGITYNFALVGYDELSPLTVNMLVEEAHWLTLSLDLSQAVEGFLIVFEVRPGRKRPGEARSPCLFHIHLDLMVNDLWDPSLVAKWHPANVDEGDWDVIEDVGDRWLQYLSKSPLDMRVLEGKWPPKTLKRLVATLDAWQANFAPKWKEIGPARWFWFGGLYDGRVRRWVKYHAERYLREVSQK